MSRRRANPQSNQTNTPPPHEVHPVKLSGPGALSYDDNVMARRTSSSMMALIVDQPLLFCMM